MLFRSGRGRGAGRARGCWALWDDRPDAWGLTRHVPPRGAQRQLRHCSAITCQCIPLLRGSPSTREKAAEKTGPELPQGGARPGAWLCSRPSWERGQGPPVRVNPGLRVGRLGQVCVCPSTVTARVLPGLCCVIRGCSYCLPARTPSGLPLSPPLPSFVLRRYWAQAGVPTPSHLHPKVPRHAGFPRGEHRGSRHRFL